MVRHVLKDGSVVEDITGKIVTISDNETLYHLLNKINKSLSKEVKDGKKGSIRR